MTKDRLEMKGRTLPLGTAAGAAAGAAAKSASQPSAALPLVSSLLASQVTAVQVRKELQAVHEPPVTVAQQLVSSLIAAVVPS